MNRPLLVDEKQAAAVVAGRDMAALIKLRTDLIVKKKYIEAQLADDTAALREARAAMLDAGMHPREADMRAASEGDADWRVRCSGAGRVIDSWLGRIKGRLTELNPPNPQRAYSAVCVPGAGKSSQAATHALNELMRGGCKIISFTVVGGDLVVVGSDPGGTP